MVQCIISEEAQHSSHSIIYSMLGIFVKTSHPLDTVLFEDYVLSLYLLPPPVTFHSNIKNVDLNTYSLWDSLKLGALLALLPISIKSLGDSSTSLKYTLKCWSQSKAFTKHVTFSKQKYNSALCTQLVRNTSRYLHSRHDNIQVTKFNPLNHTSKHSTSINTSRVHFTDSSS